MGRKSELSALCCNLLLTQAPPSYTNGESEARCTDGISCRTVRLSEIPHVPNGGSITLLLQQQQPSSQTLFRHIALKQQSLKYINTPGAVGHHKCRTGPPVAVFAHYTHCKQFDSCCYICTSQHEQTWTWIFSLMTHFMGPVQWPWTSANVNDALRVSGHRLAKREAHYSQRSFLSPQQYYRFLWLATLITPTIMW